MTGETVHEAASSYDTVAEQYAASFRDELAGKPLDRHLLRCFAELVASAGSAPEVWDLGCGPGQVTAFLNEVGVAATGLDVSPQMIVRARQAHPAVPFRTGTMTALPVADGALAGLVAFYSIIHLISDQEVVGALRDWHRALRPGGLVLIAAHEGRRVEYVDRWWDQPVSLAFRFFEADELAELLVTAGFTIDTTICRAPIDGVELPTRRVYILARSTSEGGSA